MVCNFATSSVLPPHHFHTPLEQSKRKILARQRAKLTESHDANFLVKANKTITTELKRLNKGKMKEERIKLALKQKQLKDGQASVKTQQTKQLTIINTNHKRSWKLMKVSERSERAFCKTSLLTMKCAKLLQT